ncbi:uncharacterized protein LOC110604890 [Manihot esculenta]|uniref:uncharacterized protein LOC110604890 n=1 Tax=Manihot esculenta TaxID=3983 RepID=UPI001CC6E714|nr:uncharacterized protein LOC110604890 [Manihot esculenta]
MVVTGKHIQENKTKPASYRKMCSNISLTSSGGGVGGGGCGGGYNGGYGCESIYSKKPKRQRVPKRGPGVAELEKILREQEKKPDLDKAKNEGFSLVSSPPCSYQPQSPLLPSPHSLPKPVASLAPIPNHFTPTTTAFYTNNSDSNPPLGGGRSGVQLVGSGLILPEHALLPTMWSSCEPNAEVSGDSGSASGLSFSTHLSNRSNNHLFPSTFMQRSQHSPPLMKDLFPHPVVSSSTISSPAGPCHGREPPSNQTCHHYTSLWPEEDKARGNQNF